METRSIDEIRRGTQTEERTLAVAPAVGFLGAVVFLVTPAGLAALVPEAAGVVAVGEALAFLGLVVRLIAGSVSIVWKTRGSAHTCQQHPVAAGFQEDGEQKKKEKRAEKEGQCWSAHGGFIRRVDERFLGREEMDESILSHKCQSTWRNS